MPKQQNDVIYKRKGIFDIGPEVYADKETYKNQTGKTRRRGFGIGSVIGGLGGTLAGLLVQTLKKNKEN